MLNLGQESRVYRNLHRQCYSIQQRVPRKGWRVAGHETTLYLTNVIFEVSQAGREKVLATGQKNVHAFLRGKYQGTPYVEMEYLRNTGAVSITYNPRNSRRFHDKTTGQEVFAAREVWLTPRGVYARGVTYYATLG